MSVMQGSLWKWTNYISGWQPRWFVLEGAILSYYLSHDEVTQGSRGALKVVSCDINVNKTDELRMHLVTPDKRYIYMKASSAAERQKWIVAIACSKQSDLPLDSGQTDSGRPIKTKMTELRENCNHLVTQIRNLKAASQQIPPDVKTLEVLSSTLTISCDDFLQVLQECMELCHSSDVPVTPVGMGDPLDSSHPLTKYKRATPISTPNPLPIHLLDGRTSESPERHVSFRKKTKTADSDTEIVTVVSKMSSPVNQSTLAPSTVSPRTHSRSNSDLFLTPRSSPIPSPPPSPPPLSESIVTPSLPTTIRESVVANQSLRPFFCNREYFRAEESRVYESFFSELNPRFSCMALVDGERLPTKNFIDCAIATLPLVGKFSPTVMAPIKADIKGNIVRTCNKYETNPDLYSTLQSIVESEIENGNAFSGSTSEALLWLKRAMEFIYLFVGEVAAGEQSLSIAAGKAYSKSLHRHHNWMTRGIFGLALGSTSPYYSDFLASVGSNRSKESDQQVTQDMGDFAQSLGEVCCILDKFLIKHNIEREV